MMGFQFEKTVGYMEFMKKSLHSESIDLLKRVISFDRCLSDYPVEDIIEFTKGYYGNCAFLYALYAHISKDNTDIIVDDETGAEVSYADSGYNISFCTEKQPLAFDKTQLLRLLTAAIDVLDEILPLGTVVDLKKEYLRMLSPLTKWAKSGSLLRTVFFQAEIVSIIFLMPGLFIPMERQPNANTSISHRIL